MDALTVIFLITSIVGLILVVWSFTKPGKKWLENL